MGILRTFIRVVTRVNERVGIWASFLVLPVFVMLLAEVGLRYAAGAPAIWTNELSQLLFGVYAVLSGGYLLANGGHANVDIFYARLGRRARAKLDVFTSLLFFAFVGALLYFGGAIAWESLSRLEHSQSAWNPPIYPVKLCIPLAALLLLLQGIAKLIDDLCTAFGVPLADHGVDGGTAASGAEDKL